MNVADLRLVLTPEGLRALDAAGSALSSKRGVVEATTQLRRAGYAPELAAAVLTQARLRTKARSKFGDFADHMLFTDDGLQQATRLSVAALHAGRFRSAGMQRVADLGCGIGADAIALASLGLTVTAVEADAATAAVAAFNLAPFENASVRHARAESMKLADFDAVYLDPARRVVSGRPVPTRVFDPHAFTPSLDFVFDAARVCPVGVKLGPGLPHAVIPEGCEAQWISDGGTALEVGLWFGPLARPGVRFSALVLGRGEPAEIQGHESGAEVTTGPVGAYLYDPDPAVIRARALGTLASRLDAHIVSPQIAYLSSDRATDTPFARGYAVRDVLPFDRKKLRRYVAEHAIGTLEIKKRGADVDPAELRRQLRPSGPHTATLIVTRIAGTHRAILADPLEPGWSDGDRVGDREPVLE